MQIPIRLGMMEGMQRFVPAEELFKGRHFDQEIVVLNVRWYLTYKLSYRDLVAMMAERGIDPSPHDHPALGATLHTGIPEALEPVWSRYSTSLTQRALAFSAQQEAIPELHRDVTSQRHR